MDENTYQVIIEEQVEDQIQRIVDYLIKEVSLQTAEYVRAGIVQTIRGLNYMPTIHKRFEVSARNREYRRVLKWNYIIIFHIDKTDKIVYVVDVSHASQNPQRLIDRLSTS